VSRPALNRVCRRSCRNKLRTYGQAVSSVTVLATDGQTIGHETCCTGHCGSTNIATSCSASSFAGRVAATSNSTKRCRHSDSMTLSLVERPIKTVPFKRLSDRMLVNLRHASPSPSASACLPVGQRLLNNASQNPRLLPSERKAHAIQVCGSTRQMTRSCPYLHAKEISSLLGHFATAFIASHKIHF
jgi:hypothetical protein